MKENIDWLAWHIDYARTKQIERLNAHLEEGNPIGTFLQDAGEWQIDSLITSAKHYLPKIQADIDALEKKPNKLLFWKK